MALKALAVLGCTIEPQGIVSGGVITVSTVPSTSVKAEAKGVFFAQVQFTVAGANATGYDPGTVVTVAPGTILPTAIKVKDSSGFVLRVDDLTTTPTSMTGTIGGTPTPFVEVFKITDANQTKVTGE